MCVAFELLYIATDKTQKEEREEKEKQREQPQHRLSTGDILKLVTVRCIDLVSDSH